VQTQGLEANLYNSPANMPQTLPCKQPGILLYVML